jgi:hypothetical protein
MRAASLKLGSAFLFLTALAFAIRETNADSWLTVWFILFIFVGIPFSILAFFDVGRSLRALPNPARLVRVIGIVCALPQALFALVAIALGVTLVVWVLYNSLVRHVPGYSGGFLTFGIGPALVLIGLGWLRQIIRGASAGDSQDGLK